MRNFICLLLCLEMACLRVKSLDLSTGATKISLDRLNDLKKLRILIDMFLDLSHVLNKNENTKNHKRISALRSQMTMIKASIEKFIAAGRMNQVLLTRLMEQAIRVKLAKTAKSNQKSKSASDSINSITGFWG